MRLPDHFRTCSRTDVRVSGCHALGLSLLYIVTWWGSSNTEIEGSPHSTGGPEASRCSLDGQSGSWSEGERILS